MVLGRAMPVTAVAPKYQWADTTRSARGRGKCCPNARQASVKSLRSSAFMGLPCPMNSTGILLIFCSLEGVAHIRDDSFLAPRVRPVVRRSGDALAAFRA